jgi:hypothetical protein
MKTDIIYGYKVEDNGDWLIIEALDAPVSDVTGFVTGYAYIPSSGVMEFFDADQNALYPVSFVRELAWVVDAIDDRIDFERREDEDICYDDSLEDGTR